MELTQNPPSGSEGGVLVCRPDTPEGDLWFVVFTYDPSGYVKDDEGKSLDADAILKTIRRGTAAGNKERLSRGWDTLTIDGWIHAPYYDSRTHNLTWSTAAHSVGDTSVNHSVRLLGRRGVLHADLVVSSAQLAAVVPQFDEVVAGSAFLPGNTYAEWRSGDKVASYGLTALVAGGAGAAAVKLGLFGKLWKLIAGMAVALWKLLLVAAVGLLGWARSLFQRRSNEPGTAPEPRGPMAGPGKP